MLGQRGGGTKSRRDDRNNPSTSQPSLRDLRIQPPPTQHASAGLFSGVPPGRPEPRRARVGRVCPQRAALGFRSSRGRRGEDTAPYRRRHIFRSCNAPPNCRSPAGTIDNSPALQCWVSEEEEPSPGGTTEANPPRRSRPCGTWGFNRRQPSTEVLGYSQASLRDGQNHAGEWLKMTRAGVTCRFAPRGPATRPANLGRARLSSAHRFGESFAAATAG